MTAGLLWASLRGAAIAVLLICALLPIYWMLLVALSPTGLTLTWPPQIWPDVTAFSLEGLRNADGPVAAWLWNSTRLAAFTTIATLLVSLPAGYVIARRQTPEVKAAGLLMLLSKMVPASLLIVPLYIFFRRVGLLNSDPAVVLAILAYTIPFATWLMSVYIRSIPREIEEASLLDGASPARTFLMITVPLSAPAIAAVTLYSFVIAWNDYIFARTFLPLGDQTTIAVGATTLIGDFVLEWNAVMSVATLATLPPLLLFLVLQRYFIAGLVSGHD